MAKEKTTSNLQAVTVTTLGRATRAENDEQMLGSWLANLTSAHSRRNFEVTARRFMKLRIKDLTFWPAENPGRHSGRRR